jgi:hypothetical protein
MITLSETQTELIAKWVKSHHLSIHSLENEFIDHICCDVEDLMSEGKSFKAAFESLKIELGNDLLPGLEKQTILQLTYNQRIMKFMTRLTGIIVLLSFLTAIFLRIASIDYWKTLMAGGMLVLALGFVPLFFINHYRLQEVRSQKVLHIFGFLAALLVPMSAFMGLFNSPYAVHIMLAGIFFLVLGFIPLSWLSVSQGSGRAALTGSIIFLLFFIMLSYGFLGVNISRDRAESWAYISRSADLTASDIQKINLNLMEQLKADPDRTQQVSEINSKSENLIQKLSGLRSSFILELSPEFQPGNPFFKGMDNHFAGKKFLIDNEHTDQVLLETADYKNWLMSLLSEENEQVKTKIAKLLNIDCNVERPDLNTQKNYLFRDFPAITDVSVINSLILNVRIAELQTLKFMSENKSSKF